MNNFVTETIPGPDNLTQALKETHRHIEELYYIAGKGTTVNDGLVAARERARIITDAIIEHNEKQKQ